MTHINSLQKVLLLAVLIVVTVHCKEKETPTVAEMPTTLVQEQLKAQAAPCIGNFAHNVYIWLKHPDSEADRKAFLQSLNRFVEQSQYIQTKLIGEPAATNRPIIDTTYTYSLILTFADKAAQDAYQEEAVHKQFIAESQELWEKIVIYDSEVVAIPE